MTQNLPNNARAKQPKAPSGKHIVWNDVEILKAAGNTPETVRKRLDAVQQPLPSTWAIYQWVSRKRIPDVWRPRLIYALLSANEISSANLFALENETPDAANDNHPVS